MIIVGLRYDIVPEYEVARYPVTIQRSNQRPEETDGTELDERLGAVGPNKCKLCNFTKLEGCSGHMGKMDVPRAILPNPTFIDNFLKMYNTLFCTRCQRLRNLPEASVILENGADKRELVAALNVSKCNNCKTLANNPRIAAALELGGEAVKEALEGVLGEISEKKRTRERRNNPCSKCMTIIRQALQSIDFKADKAQLRTVMQRTLGKCNNCNETPEVLEYKDFTFVVRETQKSGKKNSRKGEEPRTKEAVKLMEELRLVDGRIWDALGYSRRVSEAFMQCMVVIGPLNTRETGVEKYMKSKNKLSSIIDAMNKFNENTPDLTRRAQISLDLAYIGQSDPQPFQRDNSDSNFALESDGPDKQSVPKAHIFANRLNKSMRSVAGGTERAFIGQAMPPTILFEQITVPEYVNRYQMDLVHNLINTGRAVAYVHFHPEDPVKNYSLQVKTDQRMIINLSPGSFVERRIVEGDHVMLNRNPSLHKHNLPAVEIIRPPTFSNITKVPGPVTTVAGLDFDGDELNLIVPAGPAAPVEILLLNAAYNMKNDTTGAPVYGINQDQIISVCNLDADPGPISRSVVMGMLGDLAPRVRDWSKEYYTGREVISLLTPPGFDLDAIVGEERLSLRHLGAQSNSSIVKYVSNVYGDYEGCETQNRLYFFAQNLHMSKPIGGTITDFYFDLDYVDTMEQFVVDCLARVDKIIAQYYSDVQMKRIPHSVKVFSNIIMENFLLIQEVVTELIRARVISLDVTNTLRQMLLSKYRISDKVLMWSYCCEGMLTVTHDSQPELIPTYIDGKASPYVGWDRMTTSSLGFIRSNYLNGYLLADMMMELTYKVIPHVISQKTMTSICGSHARQVILNMEPAISDDYGCLVYNDVVIQPATNGFKMMGKDICMVPLHAPAPDMQWYDDLLTRWEQLTPFFRYENNTKVMTSLAFFVDVPNIVRVFVPGVGDKVMAPEIGREKIMALVADRSRRLYYGLEPDSGPRPSMCHEYVLLYFLDPSRTKDKLCQRLFDEIMERIEFVTIVSLSPGTEVGNRQAGNATERHTQESLSKSKAVTRVGRDVPQADFTRFKALTEMGLKNTSFKVKCYSDDKSRLEPLKHMYRSTSLGTMNPTMSIHGDTIKLEVYRENMAMESISPMDLYKMLNHYLSRRTDIHYSISVSFTAETFICEVTIQITSNNACASIESIFCTLEHVVHKGKSRKSVIDILETTMYNANLEEVRGYSISFDIVSLNDLYGLDLVGVTLSIPHATVYACRGIEASRVSLTQDLSSCYVVDNNMESMYPACKTLACILCQDIAPGNMKGIPNRYSAVIRRGYAGHKMALREAAFRGVTDRLREPYGRIMVGLEMNRGTCYHRRFVDPNVYLNAVFPDTESVPVKERLEFVPDV